MIKFKHLVSRFPSEMMKSTVVDESLSSFKPMYCSREYQTSTRYIGTISMIFAVSIGVYCFKRFCIRPAIPGHQPYSPVSSLHAILHDDVEVAPIYRHRGKVEKPVRPFRNHDLHMEWEAERLERHCKQSALAKGVPISGSLAPKAKILGMQ